MAHLDKITTRAALIPKPSKRDVHRLLVDLIVRGEIKDEQEAAELYAYFLPPVPAKPKTVHQWIAKAIAGPKDARVYLRFLYSNGRHLVGTDGHRLHLAPTKLGAGYYDRELHLVDMDHRFPDYERLIPGPETESFTWTRNAAEVITYKGTVAYRLANGAYVDKTYWDTAIQGQEEITFQAKDAEAVHRIDLENEQMALVMPLRK